MDGSTEERRCPRGHVMDAGAVRCRECWGRAALRLPKRVGAYEILERLGRGAHGEVYRARQPGGMQVALKVIWNGGLERELGHLLQLRHEHIVTLHDGSGWDHEPPYFAMSYVDGGTLAQRREEFRDPKRAVALVIQIAHAIECAHQHFVLHRDLKPTNILLDKSGKPFVSDFSVAKRIGGPGGVEPLPPETLAGTLPYMSPEQAGFASAKGVRTVSDVYGLGAILYELLTGRPPRPVETLQELHASFAASALPPAIDRSDVDGDLEAVCMRALCLDAAGRHPSAAELAADLQRLLDGEWLPWRPPSARRRIARWAQRNPRVAGSIALGALLLCAIDVLTVNRVREQQAELQQLVLEANAALAKAQAQAALAEFEKLRDAFVHTVTHAAPLLEAYLAQPPHAGTRTELALAVPGFDSLFVAACDGRIHAHSFDAEMRARFPHGPPGFFARSYAFRDYFRHALELGRRGSREVYVSRAFRSGWDGRMKFAFATPLYASHGAARPCLPGTQVIGIFFAGRSASSTLGHVQIEDPGSGQRTALFGPRDRDHDREPLPSASDFHVIVHDQLRIGDERRLDPRLAKRLSAAFGEAAPAGLQFAPSPARPYNASDYTDLVDPSHDRWLGGFYPVGKTGFVIGVQTAHDRATAPVRAIEMLPVWNLGFLVFCAGALWVSLRVRAPARGRRVEPAQSAGGAGDVIPTEPKIA